VNQSFEILHSLGTRDLRRYIRALDSREIDGRFASSYFSYPGTERADDDLVFLADRSKEDWARFSAQAEFLRFAAGDLIIRAGEDDRALYIVVAGTLEVLLPTGRGDFRRYGMIESKSVTGEIAFLDGRPRAATIRAVTDADLLRLTFESYEILAARYPELGRAILLDLGRILAARLRQANEVITRTGE
jgi:CRP/FNR family cyclic AMP-dependent transcriptional regulator